MSSRRERSLDDSAPADSLCLPPTRVLGWLLEADSSLRVALSASRMADESDS